MPRRFLGRAWRPLVPLAIGLGLLCPCATASAASASPPAFCRGQVVRDYARPLDRMPTENPPPEGELPFGPRNLSMYRLNFGAKVVLDGSHLGYRFAAKDAGTRVLHLNWDVKATLRRVNDHGRILGTVDQTQRRLGDVEDLELLKFGFPAHPGFFRFDIAFESFRGKGLASYHEYFRVVPRRVKLRVALSKPAFLAGSVAYARVFNLGTVGVELRPGLAVERAEGGGWVEEPRPPISAKSVKGFRWTLYGGQASPCVAFQVPQDAPLGRYRFTSSALVFGTAHRREVLGSFQVRPG